MTEEMNEVCSACGKIIELNYGGMVDGKEYCFDCMLEIIRRGRLRG